MEGWLHKRGPTAEYSWHRRWCVLHGTTLSYYLKEDASVKKGQILLSWQTVMHQFRHDSPLGECEEYADDRPFGFILDTHSRKGPDRPLFYFDAVNQSDLDSWFTSIKEVVESLIHGYVVSSAPDPKYKSHGSLNGKYARDGMENDRYKYMQVDGKAIIYFRDGWKINDRDDERGWLYSVSGAMGQEPPLEGWTTHIFEWQSGPALQLLPFGSASTADSPQIPTMSADGSSNLTPVNRNLPSDIPSHLRGLLGSELRIQIKSAEGLPSLGGGQAFFSDIASDHCFYVTCSINVKGLSFKTLPSKDVVKPVWDHTGIFIDFTGGDVLEFKLWDEAAWGTDTCLGSASMTTDAFFPSGFEGGLKLVNCVTDTEVTLQVRVMLGAHHSSVRLMGPNQPSGSEIEYSNVYTGPSKPQSSLQSSQVFGDGWGMTKPQLRHLLDECRKLPEWNEQWNAYEFVQRIVVPTTKGTGMGLALLLNQYTPKKINVLASHAWNENVGRFIEDVLDALKEHEVVFVCFLSLYQCEDGAGPYVVEQLGTEYISDCPFFAALGALADHAYFEAVKSLMGAIQSDDWSYASTFLTEDLKNPLHAVSKHIQALVGFVVNKTIYGQAEAEDAVAHASSNGRMIVVGNEEMGPDGSCEGLYARLWIVFELLCANLMLIPVDFVEGRKSYEYLFGTEDKSCKLATCGCSADEKRIRDAIEKMPVSMIQRSFLGSDLEEKDNYKALDMQIHIASKIEINPLTLAQGARVAAKEASAKASRAAQAAKAAVTQQWRRSPTTKRRAKSSMARSTMSGSTSDQDASVRSFSSSPSNSQCGHLAFI